MGLLYTHQTQQSEAYRREDRQRSKQESSDPDSYTVEDLTAGMISAFL